jgi:hypothetical protein
MGLLKLWKKEHDLYVVMSIGGHYLKCLRANAVSVQCKVEFIDYMCLCMCVCVCVCVHRNNLGL